MPDIAKPRELDTGQAWLASVLEASGAGSWEWDVHTGHVSGSAELHALLGTDRKSPLQAQVACVHPDDLEAARSELRAVLARGGHFAIQLRVRRPADGALAWVSTSGRVDLDPSGAPALVRGIARDITRQRQTEEALRQAEARLQAAHEQIQAHEAALARMAEADQRRERALQLLADNTPAILARFDRRLSHVFVSVAIEKASGRSRAEFIGKTNREVGMPAALCELWEGALQAVFETGEGRGLEFDLEGPGGLGHYSTRLIPDFAVDGSVESVLCVCHDVTEIKRAAEASAKFRTMFEQGDQFAGILALDGTVVEANRLCLEACGYTRADVIGRPFWECGWWSGSPDVLAAVREISLRAARGQPSRSESLYFLGDGSARMVDLSVAPVMDDAGRVVFVAATGRDITERKQAEADLLDADRRKDEFLATLAHELRNPLAPIRTGLEVMNQSPADSQVAARARKMMERQLGHMVRLIDDLLDISRISRGKVDLKLDRIELASVIEHALETSQPLIEAGAHELRVSLPREAIWLDADLTRLAQVLSNILTNAAKYTPPRGRISLVAERVGELAIIAVSDTGVGISRETIGNVFDMFAQVDSGVERSRGGLGIGLALVKRLIEMHGGSVSAESSGIGRGSTFTIRVPIAGSGEGSSRQGAEVERAPSHEQVARNILVVDDNLDGAEMLAAMLELGGHRTSVAHDGPEALVVARAFAPDVVFLDIGMPGMDGYEVARRLRADPELSGLALVALTGWGSEEDKRRTEAAGFDFHLTKPVDAAAVERVLAELEAGHMRRRARTPTSS